MMPPLRTALHRLCTGLTLSLCLLTSVEVAHAQSSSAQLSSVPQAPAKDDSLKRLLDSGVVRVADTQTSRPWSYLGDDNAPTGYDVAVAREIFKRLGVKQVILIADSFKNFVEGINKGKYDVVVNSMAHTPERDKVVGFTIPYAVQDFRIWVNKRNTDITDSKTLSGKTIGVAAGTSNEVWARAHLPDARIKAYENSGLVYSDLAIGRLDAVIDSYTNGYNTQKANDLPVKPVGEPLVYSLGAAVVPKQADALRLAMNDAITAMIADGTLQRLAHDYFGQDYDMVGDMRRGQQLIQ